MYINEYLHFMQPGENTLSHTHTHKTTDNLAVTAIIKISPQSKNSQTKNIYVYMVYVEYMYWYMYITKNGARPSVAAAPHLNANFDERFYHSALPSHPPPNPPPLSWHSQSHSASLALE